MGNALAPGELGLGLTDVADDLDLIDQGLVLIHVEDNGRALAVLGQDEGSLGGSNLVQEAGGVGAECGQRLDILTRSLSE